LRIFPALVLMLAAAWLIAWLMLLPDEFREFGRHMMAGGWFAANLQFWSEAGYFDTGAHAKPLLHLWSLGVEEQFYLVWPWLMAAFLRWPRHRLVMVALLCLASLLWNEHEARHRVTAAYFSPLGRFWELAAGGLLAMWERQRLSQGAPAMPPAVAHALSLLGMGLILGSGWCLNEGMRFPGVSALPVVAGSVMLIAAGPHGWMNRVALSAKWMVWLGLLSYGFYLWHWPLLSFLEIGWGRVPPWTWRTVALVLALFAAWLSHRFVERHIRYGPRKQGVTRMLVAMLVITVLGWMAMKRHGLPFRAVQVLNPAAATMTIGAGREHADMSCGGYPSLRPAPPVCWADKRERPVWAVWGDSKADSLFWGLLRTSEPGHRWLALGRSVPVVGSEDIYGSDQGVSGPVLSTLLAHPEIRLVVLTTALRVLYHLPPGSDEQLPDSLVPWAANERLALEGLSRTIRQLEAAGKKVVFVVDNPTLPEPRKCMPGGRAVGLPTWLGAWRWPENPACQMPLSTHLKATQRYRDMVAELSRRHPALMVFDPTPLLCPGDACAATSEGRFNYWRTDHISDFSNARIGQALNDALRGF
jgi:peptidoglycan/LPS O-acetylase OafA/YrhL